MIYVQFGNKIGYVWVWVIGYVTLNDLKLALKPPKG